MADEDIQDLKRENFNLKLRIYFLEEQGQIHVNTSDTSTSSSYVQQLQNENEGLRRRLQIDPNDERRALHEELEKCRREIDSLRRTLQKNSFDERTKLSTASVDSGLDVNTLGMSSTFLSQSTAQSELNETKERERKLDENVNSLQKQLQSSIGLTNETLAELERARRKIKQYEIDIQNYEQRQSKAERVLHRLQVEYETRIASLVEQQSADFEAYRHEPLLARIRLSYPLQEPTNGPNVNIEEYRQAIDNRDRIIQQLEKSINEMTVHLRSPFPVTFPSNTSTTTQWTDERSQTLIEELNRQMKTHLETIDQLRAECLELRRGETHLRNQIDSLTHLIHTTEYSTSIKTIEPIQTTERLEDLQTAVVQITLQLQTDAESVSGLTNRVAQILRDRDEWQEKINRLYEEIEEKNAQIRKLERREPEIEDRIRQIEALQQQLKIRDRNLLEKDEFHRKTQADFESLRNQLRLANQRSSDYERQLADERQRYEELQRRISSESQQKISLEEFDRQIRENENQFQIQRRQLERERDFEKQRNVELENDLNTIRNQLAELEREFNRSQEQIRIDENQIAQINREKDRANDDLNRENQNLRDQLRDVENQIIELTRNNNEFKSQISVYEIRLQDNEDLDRRTRHEINQLQREIQEYNLEINQWKHKYELIQSDNEILIEENNKFKQDYDERLKERLQILERNLQQANETIETYQSDIVRLKQELAQCEERKMEISQAINDELKCKNDRIQNLENQLRQMDILREEKTKILEYNAQIQHEYEQYRIEQENNYEALQRHVDDANQKNLTASEERVRIVTENKQNLIDKLENELREKENIIKNLENARLQSNERRDIQLDLEIRIEQLQQDIEVKEQFIKTYSDSVQEKEEQIEKLLDDIQQGDRDKTQFIEILRQDLRNREEKIEEQQRIILDYERRLNELQILIHQQQVDIDNINDKYQQSEQRFSAQQRELDNYKQKSDITRIDLNIALEENETHLDRIKFLENQLEMFRNQRTPIDDKVVSDLQSKLRQRDESIQIPRHRLDSLRNLQQTLADSDRTQNRYEQMEKQMNIEIENRDQMIASLRKKISEKDEEINKIRSDLLARENEIGKLRSRSRESDADSKSEYSAARAPTNVSLKLEIQKKDEEIERLQRELERARQESSSNGRDNSSSIERARLIEVNRKVQSKRFDHLNREELLYELEMARQDNEGLVQQLAKKTPNITELHHQLLDLRKELARQKYVNQVLWRKLDALIDIHGSNTRAELAIELANYHDELEALKARQHRVHAALSRSSSETSLNKKDSGVESVIESTRYTLTQRQINEKDEEIKQLRKQLAEMKRVYEVELNQYRLKSEKSHADLIEDLDDKQNDLRQARLQVDLLKSTKIQLEQAQDQNQRLQNEISNKRDLIEHYEKQISLLEKQISSRDRGTGDMTVRTSEMSELLEEMRRLRFDLQQSINKQHELQAKLDENIRLSRTPREFTFSGRGVSYPDLRLVDTTGLVHAETITILDEKRSTSELGFESTYPTKMYFIGEVETHEVVRRVIGDLKNEIKALEVKIKEKLRSKFTTALTEPSIEWLEHRLKTVTLCLTRLEEVSQFIETYWKATLPLKNSLNEHPFNDPRLLAENRELKQTQTKYIQELQNLRQRYKEQSVYMDQVLAQLTFDRL